MKNITKIEPTWLNMLRIRENIKKITQL